MATSSFPRKPALGYWRGRGLTLALAVLCTLLLAGTASAASLQVSPILVEMSPGDQAKALWLSNTGDQPIQAQVRVMGWTQQNGADQLEPSRTLLPSPPIVEIAPGQRQLVRIVRPDADAVVEEQAFRLLIDELPDAQHEDTAGLQFLLQYSVPVFVLPPGVVAQDAPGPQPPTDVSALSAGVQGSGPDAQLAVTNSGAQRVRLAELSHVDASGMETVLVPGLVGYVLAGQSMQWPVSLPPTRTGDSGRLKVRLNDDQDAQFLPLSLPDS